MKSLSILLCLIQKIAFAKEKSDIIAKKEGLNVPVRATKRPREPSSLATTTLKSNIPDDEEIDEQPAKQARVAVTNTNTIPPNKILFAQNLPMDCNELMLKALFQQCSGLYDLRIVPGNKGMAFIEFETEVQSGMALRQLDGYQLSATNALELSYSN